MLILAGVLVPLVGERLGLVDSEPTEVERAFAYTLLFVVAAVAMAAVAFLGAIPSPRAGSIAITVLVVFSIVALGGAAATKLTTATLLFGSIMIVAVNGGLFGLLWLLERKLDAVASKDESEDDDT